jgi:hypothetical protein
VGSILLDFQTDGVPKSAFGEAWVRLRIGNVELLGWGNDPQHFDETGPWISVGLVRFAMWGLVCVRQAAKLGRYALELDEYGDALLFQRDGSDMVVHATRLERSARVDIHALLTAWEAFATSVYDFTVAKFPVETKDRRWDTRLADPFSGEWFTRASWREWFIGHEERLARFLHAQ